MGLLMGHTNNQFCIMLNIILRQEQISVCYAKLSWSFSWLAYSSLTLRREGRKLVLNVQSTLTVISRRVTDRIVVHYFSQQTDCIMIIRIRTQGMFQVYVCGRLCKRYIMVFVIFIRCKHCKINWETKLRYWGVNVSIDMFQSKHRRPCLA